MAEGWELTNGSDFQHEEVGIWKGTGFIDDAEVTEKNAPPKRSKRNPWQKGCLLRSCWVIIDGRRLEHEFMNRDEKAERLPKMCPSLLFFPV